MNWPWFLCRAAGIGAWVVFSGVLSLGLATASGLLPRLGIRKQAALRSFHEQLTWVGFGLVLVHVESLLFDEYLQPTIVDLLWPFRSEMPEPFWTGLGMLALIGIAASVIAGLARKSLGAHWRWPHRLSIVAYALIVAHVIGSGTDLGTSIGIVLVEQIAVFVVMLLALRIYGWRVEAQAE